eukprot:459038-Rhodomonas_salina.1
MFCYNHHNEKQALLVDEALSAVEKEWNSYLDCSCTCFKVSPDMYEGNLLMACQEETQEVMTLPTEKQLKLKKYITNDEIGADDIVSRAVVPELSPVKKKKTDKELLEEVNDALKELGLDARGRPGKKGKEGVGAKGGNEESCKED